MTVSYAQSGEDLNLAYLLGGVKGASYIDVGCLWPIKHSNSYLFYENGGSGVCIDPNPTISAEFARVRPRDTFVNCGISDRRATLTYYSFRNPVFNTCDPDVARKRQADAERRTGRQREGRRLLHTASMPVVTLDEALQEAAPELHDRKTVDFMSIDVEGYECNVINGFSFSPRPQVIVVEHAVPAAKAGTLNALPFVRLIARHGYALVGFLGLNLYFTSISPLQD